MADRVQQMGLAEARVAVDEQRVVGLGGGLGDRHGGRVGEPVAAADDERLECVLRVEAGGGRAERLVLLPRPTLLSVLPMLSVLGLLSGLLLGLRHAAEARRLVLVRRGAL